MKPPVNAEIFESPVNICWFDESGILFSISKNSARDLKSYHQLIDLLKKLTKEKGKLCLLANTSKTPQLDRDARQYLSEEFPKYIKAFAAIADQPLGRTVTDIFVALGTHGYHFKQFNEIEEAKAWLKNYM